MSSSPGGVFGITKSLVALLGKHYVAVYRGAGAAAAGRRRWWNSTVSTAPWPRCTGWTGKTTVPLRRELFDASGNVISEDSFTQVQFGAFAVPRFPGSVLRQPSLAAQQAWVAAASPASFVASLSGKGWPLPVSLPGGLPLYAAASTEDRGRRRWPTSSTPTGSMSSRCSSSGAPWHRTCPAGSR